MILPSHLLGRQRSGEACIKEVKHPEQTDVQWPLECFSSGPWIGSPPSRREEPQMHDNFTKICTRKWWKWLKRTVLVLQPFSILFYSMLLGDLKRVFAIVYFLLNPFGIVWKKNVRAISSLLASLQHSFNPSPGWHPFWNRMSRIVTFTLPLTRETSRALIFYETEKMNVEQRTLHGGLFAFNRPYNPFFFSLFFFSFRALSIFKCFENDSRSIVFWLVFKMKLIICSRDAYRIHNQRTFCRIYLILFMYALYFNNNCYYLLKNLLNIIYVRVSYRYSIYSWLWNIILA